MSIIMGQLASYSRSIIPVINSSFQALVDSDPETSIVCVFWDFDDEIQ